MATHPIPFIAGFVAGFITFCPFPALPQMYRHQIITPSPVRDWRSMFTNEHGVSCCGTNDCFKAQLAYAPEKPSGDNLVVFLIQHLEFHGHITQQLNQTFEVHRDAVHESREPTAYVCTVGGDTVRIYADKTSNIRCVFPAVGG